MSFLIVDSFRNLNIEASFEVLALLPYKRKLPYIMTDIPARPKVGAFAGSPS